MLRIIMRRNMLQELVHQVRPLEECQPLKCAETDVAVLQPHQHRRARRRGLVAAGQRLAGLNQRKRL